MNLTVVPEGQLGDVAGIGHAISVRGKTFTMAIGALLLPSYQEVSNIICCSCHIPRLTIGRALSTIIQFSPTCHPLF